MKSYKRLTERITASNTGRTVLVIPTFRHEIIEQTNRLAELEDKIESGELCDRDEVRKETAKEILDKIYYAVEKARLESEYQNDKGKWVIDEHEFMSEFTLGKLHELYAEYGIELFGKTEQVGNSDKLEDEE